MPSYYLQIMLQLIVKLRLKSTESHTKCEAITHNAFMVSLLTQISVWHPKIASRIENNMYFLIEIRSWKTLFCKYDSQRYYANLRTGLRLDENLLKI